MRVRGLKFETINYEMSDAESHPVRVRGLKFWSFYLASLLFFVAPRAGAWIEI